MSQSWLAPAAANLPTAEVRPQTGAPDATSPPAATATLSRALTPTATTSTTPPPAASPTTEATATQPPVQYLPLSLAALANAQLADNYAQPPLGQVVLGGIPFTLEPSLFKTQASGAANLSLPQAGIVDVGQVGVTQVHLLMVAGNARAGWAGQTVGQIHMVYSSTERVVVDLVPGLNLREWRAGTDLVSSAPELQEVWRGPLAGNSSVEGVIGLLTINVSGDRRADALMRIEIMDQSTMRLSSLDPALNLIGATLGFAADVSGTGAATAAMPSCNLEPRGAFATLWAVHHADLGCPAYEAPKHIQDAEQVFQNGNMFWRADLDVYYAIYKAGDLRGTWQSYPSKFNEAGLAACPDQAPAGLIRPIRGFGNVWCALGGLAPRLAGAIAGKSGFSQVSVSYACRISNAALSFKTVMERRVAWSTSCSTPGCFNVSV